jgi:proline iminopeptidase
VPAAGSAKPTPIIRVHGGPGAYAVANKHAVDRFGQLAQDGYDVYFYDQIGSGLSERLPDPADYTTMRQVADLDAIRQKIGADQVILIGESWGGTIVSNYMAAYPQRVAKAVFSSPAPINPAEWSEYQVDLGPRLPAAQRQQFETLSSQPRFLAVYFLQTINPRAAHDFVPDRELDGFWDTLVGTQLPALVCDPAHLLNVEVPHGFGGWAALRGGSDLYDKRAALNPRASLASNQTPALILRGECDHIKAEVAQQYRETLARSTLVSFPSAGHIIYAEQPETYLTAIRTFLREEPPPLFVRDRAPR